MCMWVLCGLVFFCFLDFFQIVIISIDGVFALMLPFSLWGLNTFEDKKWTKLKKSLDFVLKILHDEQTQVNSSLLQDFRVFFLYVLRIFYKLIGK